VIRPPSGRMCWWRFKLPEGGAYRFGYCTHIDGSPKLMRMGAYNGDTTGGFVVDINDIEWKVY
jgi:hypothetical protein